MILRTMTTAALCLLTIDTTAVRPSALSAPDTVFSYLNFCYATRTGSTAAVDCT